MTQKVLLVDDDREVREALGQTLELADLTPLLAGSFVAAKDQITPDFAGIIVTDIRMPGRDGFHLLKYAQEQDAALPVILLTGEADVPLAVKAMSEGAHAFLEKPCAPADLTATVKAALALRDAELQRRAQLSAQHAGDAAARMLFGRSHLAEQMRQQVRRVASTGAEVMVTGETGSGTPKVAEVIHLLSQVAQEPFVKRSGGMLDVAALDEALLAARGGTLYLDEVTTLKSQVQFALLDRLDAGAGARVIAGSTVPPEGAVTQGVFAAELLYRLDVMRVTVPSLRERPEDIPVLYQHYVAQACEQAGLRAPQLPAEMLADLMAQPWPGNARALMSHAMRFALGVQDGSAGEELGLVAQMNRVEQTLLVGALERHAGRAGAAAETLKLPRKTFYDKLAKHGIKPEDFRS